MKTRRVKQPTEGALRDPLAGSPDCVFVFVFVSMYVDYELEINELQMRGRHLRDLDRPRYELQMSALYIVILQLYDVVG